MEIIQIKLVPKKERKKEGDEAAPKKQKLLKQTAAQQQAEQHLKQKLLKQTQHQQQKLLKAEAPKADAAPAAEAPKDRTQHQRKRLNSWIMWQAQIFTLYPEIFPGPLGKGLYGRRYKINFGTLKL